MWAATVPPFAARSTVITGIFAAFSFFTVGTIASLSVGLMITTRTFLAMRSSMLLACRAGSFCASSTASATPAFAAAACAPSRRSTKKGLFNVEMASPTVGLPAAGPPAAVAPISTAPSIAAIHVPLMCTPPSGPWSSRYAAPPAPPAKPLIHQDREQDDQSLHDLLIERRHVQEIEAVVQDADEERPQEGPADAALPAHQGGAAQDDRGDRVELVPEPGGGLRRIQPRGQDDRGDGREQAAQRVDQDRHPAHVHPGQARRLRVPSDRVDVPAHDHLGEHHVRGRK